MSAATTPFTQSALSKFWNSPTGPKTVFFYCPWVKWGIVGAGLKDLTRPAETISASQSVTLATTGLIWARYSTQIVPVSYNLMTVNLFVGCTGLYQLFRIWSFEQQQLQKEQGQMEGRRQSSMKIENSAVNLGFGPV
ncbi:hypothetical protein BDR26DRAFT_120497 [Obelidium mucronatum]|nr:hypothetical protein BDR26DRAFT_120497 [Obelidium mucronatum]